MQDGRAALRAILLRNISARLVCMGEVCVEIFAVKLSEYGKRIAFEKIIPACQ